MITIVVSIVGGIIIGVAGSFAFVCYVLRDVDVKYNK